MAKLIARYGRKLLKHEYQIAQRIKAAGTPEHRQAAAAVIERQLLTCCSPKRRQKLEAKLCLLLGK